MINTSKINIARLFLTGLAIILIFSCKKEKIEAPPPPRYVIEGHLYEDCTMEPIVGRKLFLTQSTPNGTSFFPTKYIGTLDSCETDSLGYYKFNFSDENKFHLFIRYKAGYGYNMVHEYIPKKTSYYDFDLFIHPTVNIEVHLNVINPYTEKDTLWLQDFATREGFKMPGPFKSGFAFRTNDAFIYNMSLNERYFSVNWGLLPYKGVSYAEYFTITEYCDNTIYVTIDVE